MFENISTSQVIEALEKDSSFKSIVEAVETFASIDDNAINEQNFDTLQQVINDIFTPTFKATTVVTMLDVFKRDNQSEEFYLEGLKIFKEAMIQYVQDKQLSEKKQQLIFQLLDKVWELFDEAIVTYRTDTCAINFVKLVDNAIIPTYAHPTDAGADLYAVSDTVVKSQTYGNKISTGLIMEIPSGWEVQIRPRSGLSAKTTLRLSNASGTIDSGYIGEVMVLMDNIGPNDYEIHAGDKIAQMVVNKNYHFQGQEITKDELHDTERADGGFGSTDK